MKLYDIDKSLKPLTNRSVAGTTLEGSGLTEQLEHSETTREQNG